MKEWMTVGSVLVAAILISCSSGTRSDNGCGASGRLVASTDCKTPSTAAASETAPSDQECIDYQYDGEAVLTLRHVNAVFNCCPDSLTAEIQIQSQTITIDETEWASTPCDCVCPYDLDYEIVDLPPGEYTIRVISPPEGREAIEFTVDLTSSVSGSHCVQVDPQAEGTQ